MITAQNVVIDSIPYKDGHRKVRIFLPDNYKSQKLPLLVMLDAQNLFNEKTSYAGEWKVDETISSFPLNQQSLVIAVDHGNELRMEELTPFKNQKYGGGKADQFLNWIMNQVLPQIIEQHQLNINSNKRAIAGSSLGGLFAHYAAIQHSQYFQTAGVFSPSFWWSKDIYSFTEKEAVSSNQHFFFTAGTKESDDMLTDMKKMHDLMVQKRISVSYLVKEGAQHNESQWRSSFPVFFKTWMNLD